MANQKTTKPLVVLSQGEENLVFQNYLDTNLKTYTRTSHLRVGEGRPGVLTMEEENEKFVFVEQSFMRWTRNPMVFQGEYINIHRDKNGHYQIQLRKMEMTESFNSVRVANAICTEFLTAKKMLGV